MAAKKTESTVIIPAINIQYATVRVAGDSPLIVHKWSEKAKKEILDKQLDELHAFEKKYNTLAQLSPVFEAIRLVERVI